jgi:YfiH family protein
MDIGFKHNIQGEVEYLTVESFEKTRALRHGFTTRLGGVSEGYYASMNLGINTGDDMENIKKNFDLICGIVGVDPKDMVFSKQIHSDNIYKVTLKDRGKGLYLESDIDSADGLISDIPQIPMVAFYADCVPVILLDPVLKVVCLVHSGWKGTVLKIGEKAVKKMLSEYGCDVKNILAAIGPSIGPCHYEVSGDVAEKFKEVFPGGEMLKDKGNGKYMLDLWKTNADILKDAGISDEHITLSAECTYCKSGIYFSHRASKGLRGSLAAIVELV